MRNTPRSGFLCRGGPMWPPIPGHPRGGAPTRLLASLLRRCASRNDPSETPGRTTSRLLLPVRPAYFHSHTAPLISSAVGSASNSTAPTNPLSQLNSGAALRYVAVPRARPRGPAPLGTSTPCPLISIRAPAGVKFAPAYAHRRVIPGTPSMVKVPNPRPLSRPLISAATLTSALVISPPAGE